MNSPHTKSEAPTQVLFETIQASAFEKKIETIQASAFEIRYEESRGYNENVGISVCMCTIVCTLLVHSLFLCLIHTKAIPKLVV